MRCRSVVAVDNFLGAVAAAAAAAVAVELRSGWRSLAARRAAPARLYPLVSETGRRTSNSSSALRSCTLYSTAGTSARRSNLTSVLIQPPSSAQLTEVFSLNSPVFIQSAQQHNSDQPT